MPGQRYPPGRATRHLREVRAEHAAPRDRDARRDRAGQAVSDSSAGYLRQPTRSFLEISLQRLNGIAYSARFLQRRRKTSRDTCEDPCEQLFLLRCSGKGTHLGDSPALAHSLSWLLFSAEPFGRPHALAMRHALLLVGSWMSSSPSFSLEAQTRDLG